MYTARRPHLHRAPRPSQITLERAARVGSSSDGTTSSVIASEVEGRVNAPPPLGRAPPPLEGAATVVPISSSATAAAAASAAADALAYIRKLPPLDAEAAMRRYGRSLLRLAPAPVTDFLCEMTAARGSAAPAVVAPSGGGKASGDAAPRVADAPETLLPLFADEPLQLRRFCLHVIRVASGSGSSSRRGAKSAAAAGTTVAPPVVPVAVWHALIEASLRPDVLLEPLPGAPTAAVSTTSERSSAALLEALRDEEVLNAILKDPTAAYDPRTALALCTRAGYRAGKLFLLERLRMYSAVLEAHMEAADEARAAGRLSEAKAARRELVRKTKAFWTESGASSSAVGGSMAASSAGGAASPDANLWLALLAYLGRTYTAAGASQPPSSAQALPLLDDQDALLADVLRSIERAAALPPIAVVAALAAYPAVPFGTVRDFLRRRLAADSARAADERRVVESLRADTRAQLNEADRLARNAIVFQSRRCRSCGAELDAPSVHFLCGGLAGEEHSFHAHCVGEAAAEAVAAATVGSGSTSAPVLECPVCGPDQRAVRDFRAGLRGGGAALAETFFHELGSSVDGFSKCAEYVSRGIFVAGGNGGKINS